MRKVFSIICHQMTAPLKYTVNYFSSFENNIVLIHVDSKSDLNDFLDLKKENVIFTVERENVVWGSFSQIAVMLNLMKKSASYNYDYFFLLSGDDIPLMSESRLNSVLIENFGCDFIHYQDSRNAYVNPHNRVAYNYPSIMLGRNSSITEKIVRRLFPFLRPVFFKNRLFDKFQKKVPTLYKGTNWFTLNKSSVDYICNYVSSDKWIEEVFHHSFCCDEVFFHTILKTKNDLKLFHNPSLRNDALRYVDWNKGPDYPRVLDISDKDMIIDSGMMFARKINKNENIDFMKSLMIESTPSEK